MNDLNSDHGNCRPWHWVVLVKMLTFVVGETDYGDGGDGAGPSTKSNLVASVFCPDNEGHLDSSSGRGGLGGCVVVLILDGISNDDDEKTIS